MAETPHEARAGRNPRSGFRRGARGIGPMVLGCFTATAGDGGIAFGGSPYIARVGRNPRSGFRRGISRAYSPTGTANSGSAAQSSESQPRATYAEKLECGQSAARFAQPCFTGL